MPGGQPAALLDDRGAALAAAPRVSRHAISATAADHDEIEPGRAQRVERLGERRLREAVADARRPEREALRERARDDEVGMALDERAEVLAAELEVGLVEHDDARARRADALDERGRRAARPSGCWDCTARRRGRWRPRARAPRDRARARRPERARAPRRPRCGRRPCRAGTSAWRRARVSPRPSASCAHSASTSSQPAPTTT